VLIIGSDDGLYRIDGFNESIATEATKILDTGRVMRLRQFEGIEGAFAATRTGLYRSVDGTEWTELGVPRREVYAVGASPSGERLHAGTRPAHVYVTESLDNETVGGDIEWRELEGFQELPSRSEWRLPRHDDLAQVRDLHVDPATSERVVAGVEVGGVHISEDGGGSWDERFDGIDDDVHELRIVDPGEYVAATGYGLYYTSDAGRTWKRLDRSVAQSYFRAVFSIDNTVYASGALSNSSTWDDDDADPALFACRDHDSLESIELPRDDETVTGMTAIDDDPVVATHRGSLFVRTTGGWANAGEFPVPGELTGRYTPITSYTD
jgi:hypothetical protein